MLVCMCLKKDIYGENDIHVYTYTTKAHFILSLYILTYNSYNINAHTHKQIKTRKAHSYSEKEFTWSIAIIQVML